VEDIDLKVIFVIENSKKIPENQKLKGKNS
jgi:hypothetical protein